MKNLAALLVILLGGTVVAHLFGATCTHAGRIGIAALFAFTALGHFIKTDEMIGMIPPRVSYRRAIVRLSGIFEALLAIGVLFPAAARISGVAMVVFLICATPLNIYSALQRVSFGGHSVGPTYLWLRLPFQFFLIAWVWWFAVRAE